MLAAARTRQRLRAALGANGSKRSSTPHAPLFSAVKNKRRDALRLSGFGVAPITHNTCAHGKVKACSAAHKACS